MIQQFWVQIKQLIKFELNKWYNSFEFEKTNDTTVLSLNKTNDTTVLSLD